MAIADFVHSTGLSFSLVDNPKFHIMIRMARNVGTSYKPPTWKEVSGQLLRLTYESCQERTREMWLKDADIFGLAALGDGATVRKLPLLNVLVSGIHAPAEELR